MSIFKKTTIEYDQHEAEIQANRRELKKQSEKASRASQKLIDLLNNEDYELIIITK